MKRQSRLALIISLVLMAGAAGFLSRLQALQKLGQPGVRLTQQPMLDTKGAVVGTNSVELPLEVLEYKSRPLPVTEQELAWLPPDTTYGRRQYTAADGFRVDISVVLMGSDRTSIHKPQFCLVGQGFHIDKEEPVSIPISQPQPYDLPVMKITATRQGTVKLADGTDTVMRSLYLYWFVADDELTASHQTRMWWMARDLLLSGVLQRWAYVACFAPCLPGDEDATYERMQRFVAAAVPQFQRTVGQSAMAKREK